MYTMSNKLVRGISYHEAVAILAGQRTCERNDTGRGSNPGWAPLVVAFGKILIPVRLCRKAV